MKFVLGILTSLLSVSLAQAEVCKVKLSRRHELRVIESNDGRITVRESVRQVSRVASVFASIDETFDAVAHEWSGAPTAPSQTHVVDTTEYASGAIPFIAGVYEIPYGEGVRFDVKSRKITFRGRIYRCR